MPLIVRVCACGHQWEDLVGMVQEADRSDCPLCGERSLKTAPGTFAVDFTGTEHMTRGDIAAALDNKRHIESEAPRIQTGEVGVSTSSRVPLSLRPQIPKRFH